MVHHSYKNKPIQLTEKSNIKNTNDIVVFIEKIIKYTDSKKNNVYYLLMDFPIDSSYKFAFFEQIGINFKGEQSMLEVENIIFEKGGIPREGRFYNLPQEFLKGYNWTLLEEGEYSSNYIALRAEGNGEKVKFNLALEYKLFATEVSGTEDTTIKEHIDLMLDKIHKDKIEVYIYDVGQGNWNEIVFDEKYLLIYDLGSSSSTVFNSTYNRISTVQNRNVRINSILKDNPSIKKALIISHWDVDHYNGIFDITDSIISTFDYCIVPDKIENDTTQRAYDKLEKSTRVFPIEMNTKGRGRGATNVLTEIYNSTILKLYKGTKCSDRNKRGLLLSLHTNDKDFIFPADHHYSQITDYVIPNCKLKKFNVVVPHHGGNAGNYNVINTWTNCADAVISSGNRHGHPFLHIELLLNSKFNVHRTDRSSDYYLSL